MFAGAQNSLGKFVVPRLRFDGVVCGVHIRSGASHGHEQRPGQRPSQRSEREVKQVVGKLMGNKTLEAKGKVQKKLGKAQAKFGDVEQDVRDSKKNA